MRKTLIASGAVAALAITLAGCAAADEPADGEWPESITISLVPSVEGEDLAQALDPLTGYLSDNLDIEVNGVVANNYAATVEALGADQAQVIITDAGSLYNATQQYDAELILRDVRFGATSYAAVAYTNDPDTYCEDEPVMASYDASGIELSYCNGLEEAGASAMGQGPMGVEALANASGAEVALQAATSPAGYQYPVVAMRELGIDTDADIDQIPVEGNNNAVLAVANGDAEVGFAYWDARTTVAEEMPDIADKAVAFAYTEMIPNGGVAASSTLPDDLAAELTTLLDEYADSSDEAAAVMFDLVGLSDWSADTAEDEITRYGEILEQFAN
ncbi:PhnD/SsuA/transferrin family substrate-binding protein [Microbacterium sp. JB110]|uniref:PhnD/SsuA/transferrin family substrate-binding protein n=1 Tax=Microbacterium sp. JB110 TaxID=2024477 RepID=UPI00097F6734|nr:PhnD/SsuA/transferrin family substrate-binding protein [Microbacterium sp. JB110]RCS57693.1 phosphate/phosphite/phosphonate ABC transporter substrate-binding protein [Microbacterium sp. JB110]SJM45747.1 Phosphonate ABC transporter phosphate-binding periplasmic component (TC 3.A.1.9.1) [Frigoribacterium sp. JB110]